jgi:hypothetical protein
MGPASLGATVPPVTESMGVWEPIFHEIEFDRDLGNVKLENVTNYVESIHRSDLQAR